jgi:hypothetical protein
VTGRELITASLRLNGAIASGESLAAAEATDGLAAFNRMLDSWSIEGLIVYALTQETALTLTAGDATYTLGTSGDITTRPVDIEKAIIRDGTSDYPVNILSLDEFARIPNKSIQSTIPECLYEDGGYPQRTITLYPVPSAAKQLILFTKRPLTALTLDGTISLPPGYERALVFNGAVELAPEYGKPVDPKVEAIAIKSKRAIKNANHRTRYLSVDDALLNRSGSFNFDTGGSNR